MKSAKTPPRKIKYRIYRVDVQYHDYVPRTTRSYMGVTWATSAEKAINNMKYRQGIRPADLYSDNGGDGYYRRTHFEAEKVYSYEKENDMKPIKNFENVKEAGGEIQNLPAGGYVCEIKKCSEVPNKRSSGTHLEIMFDVAEGDWRGFFEGDYKGQAREDKYWHGIINQNVPDENSQKYDMQARFFKRFTNVIEASNPGYHWDWDEVGLKGKKIGVIFGEVERESQRGTRYMATRAESVAPVDDIRSGKFKVPEPKLLSAPGGQSAALTPIDDDGELPF